MTIAQAYTDAMRWATLKKMNNGGSCDVRQFVFDKDGHNGRWVWIPRHAMEELVDAIAQREEAQP